MKNKLLALLASLVLVGCATTEPKKETVTTVIQYSQVPIPTLEPVETRNITWSLLNKERIKGILSQTGENEDFLLYTLDEENIRILIGNIQELRRYIDSQNAKIKYLVDILNSRSKEKRDDPLPNPGSAN